ncbi:metallophosphoesterase family protein [Maribacter sp. ANRC-HE7]|uniref:Metallophosphoesterase family protein n=1 Tax=Maribacter aquimaris TaxID=2737171 RepID=A0ABR7V9H8_9FLAO|nr:metallophosphoesterase family protein [Maribacter aquimaris]MBD0779987.1 metallophosphoesterase family protein [Maribacter aquimaris]
MIQNLGTLTGKILLFGGVYSNLQALEALLDVAHNLNISSRNMICTGDIIGYCSQPEEVCDLMRKNNIKTIAGNVEEQLREGEGDCGCDFEEGTICDSLSKQWYPYAQQQISKSTLHWLKTIPMQMKFRFAAKNFWVVHGSCFNISEFIFKSTPWEVKERNFIKTNADIIIAGHCGLPFTDSQGDKTWLNPGVIGMPANDGNTTVWYAVLEEVNGKIEISHHPLQYNFEMASTLMDNHELPKEYSNTLKTGIWDNCDILPDMETSHQGKEIRF